MVQYRGKTPTQSPESIYRRAKRYLPGISLVQYRVTITHPPKSPERAYLGVKRYLPGISMVQYSSSPTVPEVTTVPVALPLLIADDIVNDGVTESCVVTSSLEKI